MIVTGTEGQNIYPSPINYPVSSFPQRVPPPEVDPDDAGTLIYVKYSWEWREVLMAAIDQLLNPATWEGDHDDVITALNRATNLKDLIQTPVSVEEGVPTPFWDEDTEVDDELPADAQPWYGYVTDPTVPQDELTFFENALIWGFTGFIAAATFEVGFAPAILFNTTAKKLVLANRRGDVGAIIRIWIDGSMAAEVDTSGYTEGDVIRTTVIGDPDLSTHDLAIVQVS